MAIDQFYYLEVENVVLSSGFTESIGHNASVQLSLSFFATSGDTSKLELSRSLSVFSLLFGVKPNVKFYRRGLGGKIFKLTASFPFVSFDRVVRKLLFFRRVLATKLLRFYIVGDAVSQLVLREPLTFFPIKNSYFDYHDWKSPFVFELSDKVRAHAYCFERSLAHLFLVLKT